MIAKNDEKPNERVAIIILNWNNYEDTFECLKTLEKLNYTQFSVFLVDNNSNDGSFEKLQSNYKSGLFSIDIEFIQTNDNLGFAAGNNIAIQRAYEQGFEFFWLLNNDTIVNSNTLNPLVETLKQKKDVGIVGSKIYYYNSDEIWFIGGKVNCLTGSAKHISTKKMQGKNLNSALMEVDYITGCSLFFRRQLIDSVGYMNNDYFLYYEETDWNVRARKKGWKIMLASESDLYHKVSFSSGGENNKAPYVAYYDIRNGYVFAYRNFSKVISSIALICMFWKAVKYCVKLVVLRQNRKLERVWYIYRGLVDGFNIKMNKHPEWKKDSITN